MSKGKKNKKKKRQGSNSVSNYKKALQKEKQKEESKSNTTVKKSTALYIAIGFIIFALSSRIKVPYYSLLVSIGGIFIMLLGIFDSFNNNRKNNKGSFNYYFDMVVGILFTIYLLLRIYSLINIIISSI